MPVPGRTISRCGHREFKDEVVETMQEINGYLISFFRGQMLVSMIDGALVGIALTVIGLPYGLLIGVFVGLLGLLPYIGSLLCLVPAVLIALWHFGAKQSIPAAESRLLRCRQAHHPYPSGWHFHL
ncbi:MAG: AI-2E family transporter [Verrucomicrobiales bacterium]